MNKDKVMALVRKQSAERGVSINNLLLIYFFECFRRFLISAIPSDNGRVRPCSTSERPLAVSL